MQNDKNEGIIRDEGGQGQPAEANACADALGISQKPVRVRVGASEKIAAINMAHRQVMDHLRSGEWKLAAKLPVLASEYALDRMVASGWIERRGSREKAEIRLTPAGLDALKAPIREV